MKVDVKKIQEIIIPIAQEVLLSYFTKVERHHKTDGSVLTEADIAMQNRVIERLKAAWPDTVVLGEEMQQEQQQALLLSDKPIWCFDPLDGTSNFASGIPYFSVSLSLIYQGEVVFGMVYDPVRDECFSASEYEPAIFNGKPLQCMNTGLDLKQTTAIIDFKRLQPALATRLVTDIPYASQRSFGSVALDWCWLTTGRGQIYLHGLSNIWDYSAGEYIFRKAGGYSCTLTGEPIFSRSLERRSSVAAVDETLFIAWKDFLRIE